MSTRPRNSCPAGLSRRKVLIGAAAVAAAGLPAVPVQDAAEISIRAEAAILGIVRNRAAATALGNAALASRPELGDRKTLLGDMLNDLGMDSDTLARARTADIAGRLSAQIRDDFGNARTLMLDGWVLSLAETRLYALAALAARNG